MNKGVISILSSFVGATTGALTVGKIMGDKVNSCKQMSDKHFALFQMMNQWVKVKQEEKNLSENFEFNNYKNIAIYGMSYVGETLVNELKNTNINVKYGIDKNADRIYSEVDIVTMEDDLEDIDAIVVTAITFFDEISKKLEEKVDCPILSLEDILYEV